MGIRRKIKDRIKRFAGIEAASQSKTEVQPKTVTSSSTSEPKTIPAKPEKFATEGQTKEAGKSPQERSEPTVDEAKVAKHLARTRKGILKFVLKQGGTSSLADMHDHSERRFFVGHKKFSDLMEAMVDEGLLLYSWEQQEATITDLGREAIKQ